MMASLSYICLPERRKGRKAGAKRSCSGALEAQAGVEEAGCDGVTLAHLLACEMAADLGAEMSRQALKRQEMAARLSLTCVPAYSSKGHSRPTRVGSTRKGSCRFSHPPAGFQMHNLCQEHP